jgi:EmrB/QacA subfamily drug resistance transporter
VTQSETPAQAPITPGTAEVKPWPALFALVIGFFMILIDMTIVSVATPAIIEDFDADVNEVVWVTSAYLLAYAVPVLITGRLGDRFGPRRLYLVGLVVFTLASLACGFSGAIGLLIAARVVQGFGAAMMTPQTMAIITRIFPAQSRGQAMALWGATSGVAMLVGPILGGVLVDSLGWEWIFFINVPIGIVGFVLALRLVPVLPTHSHKFDWIGVALSGIGMFLLVFGIQEGHQRDWSAGIWTMIIAGVAFFVAFVIWQRINSEEPLVPLGLFKDRNFSLGSSTISIMGLAISAMGFPIMLYAQVVRGLTPTQAALLLTPMAVVTLVGSPVAGRFTDRVHPRYLMTFGFATAALAFWWLSALMTVDRPFWQLCLPMALLGVGNVFIWAPNAATTMRNLPLTLAGAGSGVYNASRQVGGVLGAALIAVLMDSRLAHYGLEGATNPEASNGVAMPAAAADAFASAMADSLLLPAIVLAIGMVVSLFFERPAFQNH